MSYFKIKLFDLCKKENTVVTGLFIKIYDARNRIKKLKSKRYIYIYKKKRLIRLIPFRKYC